MLSRDIIEVKENQRENRKVGLKRKRRGAGERRNDVGASRQNQWIMRQRRG
jgi:hypothetical protein